MKRRTGCLSDTHAPRMIVMDSQTGKEVANLPTVEAWTESTSILRENESTFRRPRL